MRLAAVLPVMVMVTGCTEHSAMPTWPAASPDDSQRDWRRIYPAITSLDLNAAWGMDTDDMWVVGNRGTILRLDGRTVQAVEAPTEQDLIAMDGCARDEIWALSRSGEILRWDGRQWSLVQHYNATLRTVLCLAPDDVFVGGRNMGMEPSIWRYDGRAWSVMRLPADEQSTHVRLIWKPGPGFPVMAATNETMSWFDGDSWHQIAAAVRFGHAERDLVLADDPNHFWLRFLYRLRPDGSLIEECEAPFLQYPSLIASSRGLLLACSNSIGSLADCLRTQVCETPFSINGLSVPVLPGVGGPHVFAVGSQGGFARLTWQQDHSLAVEMLLPEDDNRRVWHLVGNGTDLFFLDRSDRIYRGSSSAWQPIQTPFRVRDLKMLSTGDLAIFGRTGETRIALLMDDDTWHELPSFHRLINTSLWWIDGELRPRVLCQSPDTAHWELWGLDNMIWTRIHDLSEELQSDSVYPRIIAGLGPDDIYIYSRVSGSEQLWHHDGHDLRRLFPDSDLHIGAMETGALTQRLYLEGSMAPSGHFSGYLKQGDLTTLGTRRYWRTLCEVSEDLVFCQSTDGIYQLGAEGWVEVPGPENRNFEQVWGHPDQGLYVISDQYEIFHRDLPRGAR